MKVITRNDDGLHEEVSLGSAAIQDVGDDDTELVNNERLSSKQTLHFYSFESLTDIDAWQSYAGNAELSIENETLKIGNADGDDHKWLVHKELIKVKKGVVYKVSARVKKTTDNTRVFLGVAGVAHDKVSFVNGYGANSYRLQYYTGFYSTNDFDVLTTYFTSNGNDLSAYEGVLRGELHQDVVYVRPLFISDYEKSSDTTFLEWFKIEVVDEDVESLKDSLSASSDVQFNSVKAGNLSPKVAYKSIDASLAVDTQVRTLTVIQNHGLDAQKIISIVCTVRQGSGFNTTKLCDFDNAQSKLTVQTSATASTQLSYFITYKV